MGYGGDRCWPRSIDSPLDEVVQFKIPTRLSLRRRSPVSSGLRCWFRTLASRCDGCWPCIDILLIWCGAFGSTMCWSWVLASASTVNKVARTNSPVLVQHFSIVLQAWFSISRWYGPEFPMMFSGFCPPSTDIRGSHRLGGEAFEYAHPPARSSRTWLSLRKANYGEDQFLLFVGVYSLLGFTGVFCMFISAVLP